MQIRITVRQLLLEKGPTVWTVDPDASVFDALQLMADKNVGALPVVAGGQLVGIFSERDYARKVILHGQASRETPVRAIMTSNVVTVSPDQDLSDCMRIMTDKRIRHLPVIEHTYQRFPWIFHFTYLQTELHRIKNIKKQRYSNYDKP